jgi:hypothetical protein
VTLAASAKLGKVIDLAWVPLPAPVGAGSVVVVAGEDGSIALLDAAQTAEQRSQRRRMAAFTNLVGGRWPFPQARAAALLAPPFVLAVLYRDARFADTALGASDHAPDSSRCLQPCTWTGCYAVT